MNKQQKAHEEKRKKLLDEAYAAIDAEDEARWAEEERDALQAAQEAASSAHASFDWGAIMTDLGPPPLVANTPPTTGGSP